MTYCPPQSTSETREEQARALCLRLLTARSRTRAELLGQLTKRGYPDTVSAQALDRLDAAGRAGIAAAAERARAEELVRAKLRRETLSGDDVRITRRLVGMLARRGY